ncbi:MAG: Pr6Pr family membrane protein [Spirochaetales bacterium]|nr:Pr6Pr family membrane protein [Spirochaetales bacterium]
MNRLNKAITILLLATAIPAISYRFFGAASWADRLDLLGYFTIQSNILVILIVALQAGGREIKVRLKLAVGAAIIITGLIYQFFLRQTWNPQGVSALVSNINHGSTTVLYLLWFFTDTRRTGIPWNELWTVIPYPAVYCLFGVFEAFYRTRPIRYFFLDIRQNGWVSFAFWFAGLTVLFLMAGALVIALSRLETQKRWQATK